MRELINSEMATLALSMKSIIVHVLELYFQTDYMSIKEVAFLEGRLLFSHLKSNLKSRFSKQIKPLFWTMCLKFYSKISLKMYFYAMSGVQQRRARSRIRSRFGVRLHFSEPDPDLNFWEKTGFGMNGMECM